MNSPVLESNQVIDRKSRRHFLGNSLAASSGLAIGSSLPSPWLQDLGLQVLANEKAANEKAANDRVLVVIQLSGGNDGLNTVVPYSHELYRKVRPKIGIATADTVKIDRDIGLHPSMTSAMRLLESGRFSIVQGVGYKSPNRSHFESMDIWHTCYRKENRSGDGWLGRLFAASKQDSTLDSMGLHLGHEQQPRALTARGIQVPSIASVDQFRLKVVDDGSFKKHVLDTTAKIPTVVRDRLAIPDNDELLGFLQSSTESAFVASQRLETALKPSVAVGEFPDTPLGEKLQMVARLILAGLSTKVYYVTLDGFDTHSQQLLAHASLLRQWSDAVESLVSRLEKAGQADRVLVMTFSEFGRRVNENASQGTDHGAAAPVFFAGPSLPSQIIGKMPSLSDLDDGDLRFHTDFRSVYATLLEKWFCMPSQPILGELYSPIDLI